MITKTTFQKTTLVTLLLSLTLIFPAMLHAQTEITSLNQITDSGGSYLITDDITGGAPGVDTFTGTLTAQAKSDGTFPVISGLTQPLFTTVTGATISNIMLKDVTISQSGNVGAIACTANGASRIYNCGILPSAPNHPADNRSTVGSSNSHYCGSLVGELSGNARVINCFSYANVTGGSTVAGIVGYNGATEITQDNYTTTPMVVNCMYYGEITGGTTKRPVYGGAMIKNNREKGVNPYCYFLGTAEFQTELTNIDHFNRSWPADVEYLTRFEYYRSILNSNRRLMAWWVNGSVASSQTSSDLDLVAKWVLDPSIAPYPILKKWDKYPSVINPDSTRTWDPQANNGVGGWQTRSSAAPYRGKSHGTLSITVNPGGYAASGVASQDITRTITEMDTLNFDYGYYKVQLPYYNEVFGNPSSSDHDTRYGGNYKDYVVTGWKITNVSTDGSVTDYHSFVANWESGYNFADRHCIDKDLYATSGRVFAQGGYYYVPEGVTSITIEAYWGKAVYLHNSVHYLDRVNITNSDGDRTVGSPFTPAGTLSGSFQDQTVCTEWHTAVSKLTQAAKTGDSLDLTVYDQAIVLLSNFQLKNKNGAVGVENNKWYPYTIMSIDQDLDNEPDYCFELQFRSDFSRPAIQPIRFDFLPVPELGMAVRHDTKTHTIGIFVPQGHFEITETSFMHTTQFEYDGNSTRVNSPVILNGGHFEQIVVRYGPQNKTQYFVMGGHFRMLRFTPGAHTNRSQKAKVRLCAVNAIGGDYPEFYLSGIYRPDIDPESIAKQGNPHCYTNGGRFGIIAGAGYDKILGDITFKIEHSIIGEFYGGGINGANPVGGNIRVTINHSIVDKYCGGPKVGAMASEKTVITHATGTHFGRYYGGGNGGTSYYREQGYDGNDRALPNPSDSTGWANLNVNGVTPKYKEFNPLNTRTGTALPAAYDNTKGYHALYEFECFIESNGLGGNPTLRTYTHWAQFGTTATGDITNVLDNCIIDSNFYGGGNLGNVNGNVTSILSDTEVKGNVCGGGFSGKIEPFRIHDKSTTVFPVIDYAGVMHNGTLSYLKDGADDRYYTWCYKNPDTGEIFPNGLTFPSTPPTTNKPTFQGEDGKWYVLTTVSLEGLGAVSDNVSLTLKGNTVVGTLVGETLKEGTGNVYGGGDESAVNGNTSVNLCGATRVLGNVFGGGNEGEVGGNSSVTIIPEP